MKKLKSKKLLIFLCAFLSIFFCGISFINQNDNKVLAYENEIKTTASENISATNLTYKENTDTTLSYYCLADKYMFVIEDQDSFGLCWDFSSLTVIENYLAVTTGELYDFSEAWVALCMKKAHSSYVLGDGGDIRNAISVINQYGILYEDEFPMEMLYNIDDSNYDKVFEMFKDKAHKDILPNLQYVNFMFLSNRSDYVKKYLTNYGALSISYDDNYRVTIDGVNYVCTNNVNMQSSGAHSITLIGWDDDISFTDKDGNYRTGAYICLNSWGTNTSAEVIYISYEDLWSTMCIFGVNTSKRSIDLEITNTSSSLDNLTVNKYNKDKSISSDKYQEKNIWFYGDSVSLTYNAKYNGTYNTTNAYIIDADIKKDNCQINDEIDTLEITSHSVEIADNNLDSGVYYVYVYFDTDADNTFDVTVIKQFTIFSGAETSIVSARGSKDKIYQNFNKVLSSENENIIYGYTYNSEIKYEFYFANHAKVNGYKYDSSMKFGRLGTFIKATESNYTKGVFVVTINTSEKGVIIKNVTFELSNGRTVTYKIITYSMTDLDKQAYVFYNYQDDDNGVKKTQNMLDYIAVGSNFNSSLQSPENSKQDRQFDGWYTDASLLNKLSVMNAALTQMTKSNYYDKNYANVTKYTLMVYAKWSQLASNVQFDDETIRINYGEAIDFNFLGAYSGSGDYEYTSVVSNFPTDISVDLQTLNVQSDQVINVNNYTIRISVLDKVTNQTITATKKLVILPRNITYTIDNKSSKYQETLQPLTGSVTDGQVVGNDDLMIELFCDVTITSGVGSYEITGISRNNNYNVTFVNGVYKIIGNSVQYEITSFEGEFDNNSHKIAVNVKNCDNYQIFYKLEGGTYSVDEIDFTNFTNGKITVFFKITATGFDDVEAQGYVNILKRKITLKWEKLQTTYNGASQYPTASISTDTYGVDLNIDMGSGNKNAGKYNVTATVDSENFEITNPTVEFTISKARPNISTSDIVINQEQLTKATKLKEIILPAGYSWKNPEQELVDGENICLMIYTPNDLTNYNIIDNIELTITRKTSSANYLKTFAIVALATIVLATLVVLVFKLQRYVYEKNVLDRPQKVKVQKPKGEEVLIQFVTNSPIVIPPVQTYKRLTIKLPQPQRNYYEFCGWYTDKLFLNKYENNGVNNNLTLYAKWEPKSKNY